jgi:hypothetical protein
MDAYPLIEPDNGGSAQGTIDTLNRILELTVPSKSLQEAGTFVIPAHGRISDEHEVLMYRDMVYIVRDRIRAMARGEASTSIPALSGAGPPLRRKFPRRRAT